MGFSAPVNANQVQFQIQAIVPVNCGANVQYVAGNLQISRNCNTGHNIEISNNASAKTDLNFTYGGRDYNLAPGKRVSISSAPVFNQVDTLTLTGDTDASGMEFQIMPL
jgi:hypothetical protein